VTAHPIELIAEMGDGIDLDQKDQVTRHIASCDTCRTVARTMQRIDGLIAMPEPVLPLPARVAPVGSVHVAGWTAVVAVVLTLAVTLAVLVGSFRQTQVATSAVDTCGVLAAASRSAGVRAATAKAAAIELPSSFSGSWAACTYRDSADPAGRWLLFRSRPTEGREVRSLLVALTTGEPNGLVFGKFSPALAFDGTERWKADAFSRGSETGQAMAVLAAPYFFVVMAPGPDATDRLTEAVLAELRQRPWPPLSATSKTDACAVIRRAASAAGLPTKDASGSPPTTFRHWEDMSMGYLPTETLTNVCAYGPFDRNWFDPHLLLREESTTRQQARDLLPRVFGPLPNPGTIDGWTEIESGIWLAHGETGFSLCRDCALEIGRWSAVAVSDEPYFFVVTQATDEAAMQLARAVLAELKRP